MSDRAPLPHLRLHADLPAVTAWPDIDPSPQQTAHYPLQVPESFRPLIDETDDFIRALFACGFTSAAVQGRSDIGVDLSEQLTTLIDTLDRAIRGIRNALGDYDAV